MLKRSKAKFSSTNTTHARLNKTAEILQKSKVIQHYLTDDISMVFRELEDNILYLSWESARENYKTNIIDLETVLKVIDKFSENRQKSILIKCYDGINLTKDAQMLLQRNDLLEMVSAISIVLHNSTQRLSLNIFSKLNRTKTPMRGFSNLDQALLWLQKKEKNNPTN